MRCMSFMTIIVFAPNIVLGYFLQSIIPDNDEVITGVIVESEEDLHILRKRSITSSIQLRIYTHYDETFIKQKNADKLREKILQPAIDYFQSILSVKEPVTTKLLLDRKCNSQWVQYARLSNNLSIAYCVDGCAKYTTCGHSVIPNAHLHRCRKMHNETQLMETGTPSGEGVHNADYILYISAAASPTCTGSSMLAYAAHCQLESRLDRPIAGYINFCPGKMSAKLGSLEMSLFTAKHELLHALGFGISLYAYFRDPNGSPYTTRHPYTQRPNLGYFQHSLFQEHQSLPPLFSSQQSDNNRSKPNFYQWSHNVTGVVSRDWLTSSGIVTRNVTVMMLPNVVREARLHFNCSTLEGMELENQGPLGVSITHWEKRLLGNELMTGTFTTQDKVSRITLALMEDTGWYAVDYSKADHLAWGYHKGCKFVQSSCLTWLQQQSQIGSTASDHNLHLLPFCTALHKSVHTGQLVNTTCTGEPAVIGYCNLVRHPDPLPVEFRYFSAESVGYSNISTMLHGNSDWWNLTEAAHYGGAVQLADFCPFVQSFNLNNVQGEVFRTSSCKDEENNQFTSSHHNFALEQYGEHSICLNAVPLTWSIQKKGHNCGVKLRHKKERNAAACISSKVLDTYGAGCYQYYCHAQYGVIVKVASQSFQCLTAGQIIKVSIFLFTSLHEGSLVCPSCTDVCKHLCPLIPELMPQQQDNHAIDARQHFHSYLSKSFNSGSIRIIATILLINEVTVISFFIYIMSSS